MIWRAWWSATRTSGWWTPRQAAVPAAASLSTVLDEPGSLQVPVHAFFAYLQASVKATLVVFRPDEGQLLCTSMQFLLHCARLTADAALRTGGRVTKLGLDSIALLVLNVFNAYVGLDDIRPDIQYNAQVLLTLLLLT